MITKLKLFEERHRIRNLNLKLGDYLVIMIDTSVYLLYVAEIYPKNKIKQFNFHIILPHEEDEKMRVLHFSEYDVANWDILYVGIHEKALQLYNKKMTELSFDL